MKTPRTATGPTGSLRATLALALERDERLTTGLIGQLADIPAHQIAGYLRGERLGIPEQRRLADALERIRRERRLLNQREYVSTEQLAERLTRYFRRYPHEDLSRVALRAGVTRRAIRFILDGDRPFTTIYLADRLLLAIGEDIGTIDSFYSHPSHNIRP